MSSPNSAFELASYLHDSFFLRNEALYEREVAASSVRTRIGSASSKTSERVEAYGVLDGRAAKQTLAKSKLGIFYLSTTFLEENGTHRQQVFEDGVESPHVAVLEESLIFDEMLRILMVRNGYTQE